MISASGINDVIRMYNTTQHDGIPFQPGLYRLDFTEKLPAAVRPRLYAGLVRLRLPTCAAWLRLGEAATSVGRNPRMFGFKSFPDYA